MIRLEHSKTPIAAKIKISGSKSISNRLLILKQFCPDLILENLSDSDDTQVLIKALQSKEEHINVGHAGTAMRFLLAYFATQQKVTKILNGSERMQQRPVAPLVEALRQLGAKITYLGAKGYPPVKIHGFSQQTAEIDIKAGISSQFITALLLVGHQFPMGLDLHLQGRLISKPYVQMTIDLLAQLGVAVEVGENRLLIEPQQLKPQKINVEPDWSSASYFYSALALAPVGSTIFLYGFKTTSLQGDARLISWYQKLGVETQETSEGLQLQRVEKETPSHLSLDLVNNPDLAQTLAVTCLGLGMSCDLSGLQSLKIKETDRLQALKNEMQSLGATLRITDSSLHLSRQQNPLQSATIKTYQDHRMAMAFAALALKVPLMIENEQVVAKSYRSFWKDWEEMGFFIN